MHGNCDHKKKLKLNQYLIPGKDFGDFELQYGCFLLKLVFHVFVVEVLFFVSCYEGDQL